MAQEIKRKEVGAGWTWFEDYIYLWAKWTASCPANRQVQVGMGISTGGEPRGEKIRFSGIREFTTIGAGSIHFRVTDGGPPCLVILYSGSRKGVPIIRGIPFFVGADKPPSTATASKYAGIQQETLEAIERFNAAAAEMSKLLPEAHGSIAEEMEALRARSDELESEARRIRAARKALRNLLLTPTLMADMGADCDADYCHTEKKNETISAGETDSYAHDDQDRGSVTVHCNLGEIEVVLSAAVWSTFEEIDRKRLRAGDTWQRDIPSKSGWYDQTNRVEVIGKADSNYNLDFSSWDD
jgi:hypothetical protein